MEAPTGPDGELDFGSTDRERGLSLLLGPEMGTKGGISFGGKVLNPLADFESRSESLCPCERGLFEASESDDFSGSLPSPFSFFSKGGMIGLEGEVSLPMALHVWARSARGDFFASSWGIEEKTTVIHVVKLRLLYRGKTTATHYIKQPLHRC